MKPPVEDRLISKCEPLPSIAMVRGAGLQTEVNYMDFFSREIKNK